MSHDECNSLEAQDVLIAPTYHQAGIEKPNGQLDWTRDGLDLGCGVHVRHLERARFILDTLVPCWRTVNPDGGESATCGKPHRQYGMYYALIRYNAPRKDLYSWDADNLLQRCAVFSRVVHDTAIGYTECARLLYSDSRLHQVIPFPGYPTFAVGMTRPWLDEREWKRVADMMRCWPFCCAQNCERFRCCLYYFEKVAFERLYLDRWPLLGSAVEALLGFDWTSTVGPRTESRKDRFCNSLLKLGEVATISFTRDEGVAAWERRSRLAHGIRTLPATRAVENEGGLVCDGTDVEVDLYRRVERIVAFALEMCVLYDGFAANFVSNDSVARWLSR